MVIIKREWQPCIASTHCTWRFPSLTLFSPPSFTNLAASNFSCPELALAEPDTPPFDRLTRCPPCSLLKMLIDQGKLTDAVCMLGSVAKPSSPGNDYVYVRLLQLCVRQKAFSHGMHVHDHIVRNDLQPNLILSNALINLYGKRGLAPDARQLFDAMAHRDVFSWTIMIEVYAKHEFPEEALHLFSKMEDDGIKPDEICLLSVLKACGGVGSVHDGKYIHTYIIFEGFDSNVLVNSSLIDMYSKCRSLDDAFVVFLLMPIRDAVVWNLMISGYAECFDHGSALILFKRMLQEGIMYSGFTLFCILDACISIDQCRHIHALALNSGVDLSPCFFNNLINKYCRYKALVEARKVFDKVPNREIVTWNTMLSGYVQIEDFEQCLISFQEMVEEQLKPDSVTIAISVKACTGIESLREGMEIHKYVFISGMESDKFISSTLIDMYGTCGELENAYEVFYKLQDKDVVCWNSMISVFIRYERAAEALELFREMVFKGIKVDEATFICILKACAYISDGEMGKCIHFFVTETGFHLNIIENTLIDMYSKCNSLYDACTIFSRLKTQDLVSWNAMITAYALHNHLEGALGTFEQMQSKGLKPDKVTCLAILKACTNAGSYEIGKKIHGYISKAGHGSDIFLNNALIDMYAKCGRMDIASDSFHELCQRDIVSWNAIITGYFQHGHTQEIHDAFNQMIHHGVRPNEVTFIAVLKACSNLAIVNHVKRIHVFVRETVHGSDAFIRSTLLDTYSKCGNITDAAHLFQNLTEENVVSCNVMIAGYAQHGLLEEALTVFDKMYRNGDKLDHVTYIAVISACSYMGQLTDGFSYFKTVKDDGMKPSIELYGCVVDLISRAGQVDEALMLLENLYCQPNVDTWMALLAACKYSFNNPDLANYAADFVLELEPENTAAVLLLWNSFT